MNGRSNISFEFFPPRTEEGRAKLKITRQQLQQFKPEFFSVTYGAGGSTRDGTLAVVQEILDEGYAPSPHLACIGMSRAEICAVLDQYRALGIRHIVALRGDMPSGMIGMGDLSYACELVRLIRELHGDWFHVSVAGYPEYHPQARSAQVDLQHFADKVKAGADEAITQYFFNADAYFAFVDEVQALGVDVPIMPGIMPIAGFTQLARFSDACGTEIPRWLRLKLQSYGDDTASIRSLGLDVVTELADRLLSGGAPGLHFYTLNQAGLVSTICQRLGM